MEIKEIDNKDVWENFLLQCSEKTFLQSWNWGEFNVGVGCKIWRFGAYNNGELIAVALAVGISARRGTFLFIPHGPIFLPALTIADIKEIFTLLLVSLRQTAKDENASFIRVAPLIENEAIFEDLGFKKAPMHSSAYEATWRLDISREETDLLAGMRKTTRYLIKKTAENPDISIRISYDPQDIEAYQKLNNEVARRQKFVAFSDDFIRKEFDIFNQGQLHSSQAVFLFGQYKGEIACGAMIIFWQGIAFYHQAASLGKFAKFSIPYLLQWEAIKEAKKKNCKIYDFWGFTDPEKFPKHPWAGPTLFKMGFGGYKKEYVKTQDLILSSKYWINYIIESIRKRKRNL